MNLIIVESPTKARTLSRFLGGDFQIEATIGHIRDLPKSELGVDIERDFKPRYVIPTKKRKRVNEIRKIAEGAEKIILATDPDREGEAIAWHVADILKMEKDKINPQASNFKNQSSTFYHPSSIQRIVFHEITEEAVKEALGQPRSVDMDLVNAQQARRVLDRLVGYKLSPLLWQKIQKRLSAGRVQSVTLRLIVEREREIEAFKQEEYWEIEAQFMSGKGGEAQSFHARLSQINGQKAEIRNEKEALAIKVELEKIAPYLVSSVEVKEVRRQPPPPFMTSTLQQTAGNLFFWPTKKTMQIAQKLYEEGLITYHRTDSVNLAEAAIKNLRQYIAENYNRKYLPETPKIYKTKSKVAQEAHEAIRPTDCQTVPLAVYTRLGKEEGKLYELIWQRALACQMREALYEQVVVEILGKSQKAYLLRANGMEIKFDGWQTLYGQREEGQKLPPLETNEEVILKKPVEKAVLASQHFTEPPSRFSEATLVKALEEKDVGRPSTYAPIISTIQEREYVEKVERRFQPTKLGFAVNDFLVKYFPQIDSIEFTAKMENELDGIARGEEKWVSVIRSFYEPFEKDLVHATEVGEKVKVEIEVVVGEKCEKCGAPLVLRRGRYGKFLACSRFPECDFTKKYQVKTGLQCPKCGGDVVLKKTRKGGTFYGCSNYPDCKFASWRKPQLEPPQVSS